MTDTAPEVSPPTSTAPGRIKVPSFVGCFGKKGSGKSYLAATLWLSYTGDRLCIDPTGDVWDKDLQGRPGMTRIEGGFAPDRWPKKDDERRASIVYQPQRRDARWRQMVDSWIRLAMERGRICVWFDEFGLVTTNNYTPPETADLLHTGRHREITLIECAPRPKRIDPLGLTQLDMIYMFELPAPQDRRAIAESVGVDPGTLDAANAQLGPYEHLRIDVAAPSGDPDRLLHMEPLPRRR